MHPFPPADAAPRKALEKRGAVQARDRIRSATARKFTQQIIDTILGLILDSQCR
jgi:hypothetical protein